MRRIAPYSMASTDYSRRICSKAHSFLAAFPGIKPSPSNEHEDMTTPAPGSPRPFGAFNGPSPYVLAFAVFLFLWQCYRARSSGKSAAAPATCLTLIGLYALVGYLLERGVSWITIMDKGIVVLILGSIGTWIYKETIGRKEEDNAEVDGSGSGDMDEIAKSAAVGNDASEKV